MAPLERSPKPRCDGEEQGKQSNNAKYFAVVLLLASSIVVIICETLTH